MKIIRSNIDNTVELPLDLTISFKPVYDEFKKYAGNKYKDHPYHPSSKKLVTIIDKHPILIEGFQDESILIKHQETIDLILSPLFPDLLTDNEIKAATVPFSFTSFKFSDRFQNILNKAGDDYVLEIRNFEEDLMYIISCTYILGYYYNYKVDAKRPFFFDIPDVSSGITKHYRAALNGDFTTVTKEDWAPEITYNDYLELLENFENIAIWKEKFPPNSYKLKGFGIINLFDVTSDHNIASIQANLLNRSNTLTDDLQNNLREFFGMSDLQIGYSSFRLLDEDKYIPLITNESVLFHNELKHKECSQFFCNGILKTAFERKEIITLSSIDKYGVLTGNNSFYQQLKKLNLGSVMLIPITSNSNNDIVIFEIASPNAYDLNTINQNKLKDIVPALYSAIQRSIEESHNIIEATIQEHYTSLHPSVKWRFVEAAEKFTKKVLEGHKNITPEEIVFHNVYPLYAQTDIKGSSNARNITIKEDLSKQLNLAVKILDNVSKYETLPIYEELSFRIKQFLQSIDVGLSTGEEISIIEFLKRDVNPVFKHIRSINNELKEQISSYQNLLDPQLDMIYEKRRFYENSVTQLNNTLAQFVDQKQQEAQNMFPHYFERYKTDGVEHTIYIGKSLVKNKSFDLLYLHNIRLWQLQMVYQMENIAYTQRSKMEYNLEVASLILAHNNPLTIRFRMDEKQFDVDGAYNIRYEIIKKRVDKALIKGSTERLTVPGKIAIVYWQSKTRDEYLQYIKFLQSKNCLGKIEDVEIEDLQGVTGLRALRAEVIYHENFGNSNELKFEKLLKELEIKK